MVTVTNKEIYDKLCSVECSLISLRGRQLTNQWIATTALTLCIAIIFYLINGGK